MGSKAARQVAERQGRTRGIAWAGAVNLIGGVTGSVVALALAAVVGHHLGAKGAGTYFLVVAVFMIVSNVAELGADTGLVRFISSARATDRDGEIGWLIRTAIAPVLLIGLGVVAVAGVVVRSRPELFPDLSPSFILIAATVAVVSSLTAIVLGDRPRFRRRLDLSVVAERHCPASAPRWDHRRAHRRVGRDERPAGLVGATPVRAARRIGRRRQAFRQPGKVAPRCRHIASRMVTREFWAFSATRGMAAAIEILLEWADVLIVGALTSPTSAGIYAVATRCARGGEVVQQAARIAIGPVISAALARQERDTVRVIYGLVTAAMIWVAWPFYFVLAIFGSTVLDVFGPGFADGTVALATLAMAMGVATAAGAVQTILLMGGRGGWQLADKAGVLVLNVTLDFVLVPIWGIRGAAVAWAIAILVDTGLVVWQVQGLMGLRPRGRHIRDAAAVALTLAGVPLLVSRLLLGSSTAVLLGTLALVVPVYLVVGWILRVRLGLEQLVHQRGATRPVIRATGRD